MISLFSECYYQIEIWKGEQSYNEFIIINSIKYLNKFIGFRETSMAH